MPHVELDGKLKDYVARHHWKVLNIMCCLAFTWQLYGIVSEWVKPSQKTTDITEKKLDQFELPLIFKICPDPGFNLSAIREEGYDDIWHYFYGRSSFNNSIFGWAGHTNTSETRGRVEQVYKKVLHFPTPESFIKW